MAEASFLLSPPADFQAESKAAIGKNSNILQPGTREHTLDTALDYDPKDINVSP